jgi:hypothetical protein
MLTVAIEQGIFALVEVCEQEGPSRDHYICNQVQSLTVQNNDNGYVIQFFIRNGDIQLEVERHAEAASRIGRFLRNYFHCTQFRISFMFTFDGRSIVKEECIGCEYRHRMRYAVWERKFLLRSHRFSHRGTHARPGAAMTLPDVARPERLTQVRRDSADRPGGDPPPPEVDFRG